MVSTGAMRVCEVRCCQLAHEALLLVHDAGEAGELVLESDAEVARVGGFFDQRARDRLHFVVLVEFQRVEVRVGVADGMQLVARGHAADVDGILELEQALLDGAVLIDQLARMAGRRISIPARARRS